MEARIFKWSCLALAAIATGIALWMVNDLRAEVKRTNAAVQQHLPEILANAKQASETIARVSKDVESLRDLAGLSDPTDRSLVSYADELLDLLDGQTGQIGLAKLIGKGLKDLVPVQAWVRDARKEALWLTFRASTKAEMLDRLAKNKFGSSWYFVPAAGEPVVLLEWIQQHHPASRAP